MLVELVEFGEQQVFSDATTYPVIFLMRNEPPSPEGTFTLRRPALTPQQFATVGDVKQPTGNSPWVFITENLQHIIDGWADSRPLGKVLIEPPYRGVTTGFNRAFVLPQKIRDRLIQENPNSSAIIKPLLRGEDLRPWYQEAQNNWLIFTKRGIDIDAYPNIKDYLQQFRENLEPQPTDWDQMIPWLGRKAGHYKWYEIQDSVEYFRVFEKARIHSTKVSLYPAFSLLEAPAYAGNTSYVLPVPDVETGFYLLGLLNSRVCEYFSRSVFAAKANGYYEVQPEALARFPVPNASDADREAIGGLAREITDEAKARYTLHEKVRRRLRTDFDAHGIGLNQKLTAWWTLDFAGLQKELLKVFKKAIAVRERDEWEDTFNEYRAAHNTHTDAIIRRETDLNARVYALFHLVGDEIKLIEAATKYKYGEV